MPRYIRAATPGATYFFTVTLQDRQSRWLTEHIGILRRCLALTKAKHPFHIDAMVVLPEHLHAVWTLPEDDANFPLRWLLIKRRFTRQLLCDGVLDASSSRRRGDTERALWNRRYWEHQIRDDDDFGHHVDYIHYNPVKHGLVTRAADWPHSSFHRYVRQGLLRADWGLAGGREGRYGE
ncbi:MAG: transposase like family protein [Ramlibacter sp.]|nr:transposase like family protein [Ramlibacter sp.]